MSTTTPRSASKVAAKKSLIVTLTLTPAVLAQFTSSAPSPVKSEQSSDQAAEPIDKSSDSNATPVPNDGSEVNGTDTPKDGKKKRAPPNPNARKRAPPMIDPNAPMRERGRPGPKKKQKTDGTTDRPGDSTAGAAPTTTANGVPAHKLGPKANTGAINAGLRALDRSGKPCRRWEKKPLQLKSFTGMTWGLSSWKAPTPASSSGENGLVNGSDGLPAGSSNVGSERSAADPMVGIESSPAPIPAPVAIAA